MPQFHSVSNWLWICLHFGYFVFIQYDVSFHLKFLVRMDGPEIKFCSIDDCIIYPPSIIEDLKQKSWIYIIRKNSYNCFSSEVSFDKILLFRHLMSTIKRDTSLNLNPKLIRENVSKICIAINRIFHEKYNGKDLFRNY